MKRLSAIIFLVLAYGATTLEAQNKLILHECKQLAVYNYPFIRQYKLVEQSSQYTLENIAKNYLPQIGFNAQATYQSEVTKLSIDQSSLPFTLNIPSVNKDQYKATVDVSQLIWDGGATASQKKVAQANSNVDKQRIDVGLYAVKDKINQLYFGILAVDEQLGIVDLTEKNLKSNREVVASMLRNGVAMQPDADLLDVELLSLDQTRITQKALRKAYVQMLSLFIHKPLADNVELEKPLETNFSLEGISRPELNLYASQMEALKTQNYALDAKNRPKLALFAQGGYGRPGLNMMEDKFKLFGVAGVKLSWNFGGLYTQKNEQKLIETNINNLEIQQEAFLFNTNLELTKEQSEIQKMKDLLSKDDDIIQLRARVKLSGESRYKNGTYQMNELIRDINNESLARQTKALHEIQYLMNVYNYKQIQGK
jgi:outer membrane protein TolC